MRKNSRLALVFYLVLFVNCFMTVHAAGTRFLDSDSLLIKRTRALVEECGCPYSCVVRIKSCLRSGQCSSCKIPTYGKRDNGFYHKAYLQSLLFK